MVSWNNLDTLNSFKELSKLKKVSVKEVMTGEKGAKRAKEYSVPMACGMDFNYAAKAVDDDVRDALAALADEAQLAEKFAECDGLRVAAPVYYGSANGSVISLLDRLFYSSQFDKTMKVGAAVACARRGGLTATWDELNKYFGISGMPIASGQYWNGIHGAAPGQATQDAEGLQQMRIVARNMAFLMRAIAAERDRNGLPEQEEKVYTNFIR